MIRVALFSHSPSFAGAERMLFNMALLLKETNIYEPIIFIPDSTIRTLYDNSIKNNIIAVLMPQYTQYIYISDTNKSEVFGKTLESVSSIIDLVRKSGIDIIIANTATSIVPTLVSINLQIPTISWIHGILDTYHIDSIYSCKIRLYFDRLYIALSDYVICCSEWTEQYYKRYSFGNIRTLNNWTPMPKNIEEFDSDSVTFVCLNTFNEQKGILTLLNACIILHRMNINFNVHFYGDGSEKITNDMKNLIIEYQLEGKVFLKQRVSDTAMVYNSCLCLVQPSYIEPFGMTIIEAMSYERPVIATRSGGPDNIVINGETGFLIERNNAIELAEKMKYLLDNKKIAQSMGLNGKRTYEVKYTSDVALLSIKKIIDLTIKGFKGIDKNKKLLADSLLMLLETNYTIDNNMSENAAISNDIKPNKIIISEYLALSSLINKSKRYIIKNTNPTISEIGVIFTTYDNTNPNGCVYINVYVDSKKIRTSKKISLREIINNHWTYFEIEELNHANKKYLLIELNFEYEPGSSIYGVYEDIRYHNIKYRLWNKIGKNDQVVNVLFSDCRK